MSLRAAGALTAIAMTTWGCAAVAYSNLPETWRVPAALLFALASGALLLVVRPRRRGRWGFIALFVLVLVWWYVIPPSNDRAWQPDVAVLPYADIAADRVTIHHIRNCDYRSETDFDVRHYDRTFLLDQLLTVDLFMVYWGSPNMAHTMVSFGFADGGQVCFSIETRKETGEGYSAVKGLFRQFELTYVVADERDLVRLRTNYRQGEDVYLYRLRMAPKRGRELFLEYLRRANHLREQPEWYNAVSSNCTTAIRAQNAASDRAPWDWRMLINGHLDSLLYESKVIATHLPLAELKARSLVNATAQAADHSPEFSRLIRQTVPTLDP